MSHLAPGSRFSRLRWLPGGSVAVITCVVLSWLCLRTFHPPWPNVMDLTVVFGDMRAGRNEPLITTGETGAGEFVFVKFLGDGTAAFGYDLWGAGGPVSAPVKIAAGVRYPLHVELPSLGPARGPAVRRAERLRVIFNGAALVDAPGGAYEPRKGSLVFFGENPIGGSSCGPNFSGEIARLDGRPLHGKAQHNYSVSDQIVSWIYFGPWQVLGVLLASGAAGWAAWQLGRLRRADVAGYLATAWRAAWVHRWFALTTAGCAAAFAWMVTDGTFRFGFPESFGDFYDYQAASLLQGRLDVPGVALSGEAFSVGGKLYGYFGLTPALLRLPFAIYGIEFGCLSRSFMLGYFIACLTLAYLTLLRTAALAGLPGGRPANWITGLFLITIGLGSTLFFLSSRAYIYHEAALCGAMFALLSGYCTLRYLAAPGTKWWLGGLIAGVLSVHSRPPVGLFALTLLGCAALFILVQTWTAQPGTKKTAPLGLPLAIGALSILGVLSFNGLSYLKFKTFDGAPLKYHVQYHPARLAKIDGKNFHAGNFRFNFSTYAWWPSFVLPPTFPYFTMRGRDPEVYPESKIDLAEGTLALPYSMPCLVFLALLGCASAWGASSATRRPVLALNLAIIPMATALLTAVAVSQRYTADFCPWLIFLAAFGLPTLQMARGPWRGWSRTLIVIFTVCSLFVTGAITFHYQGERIWGVPEETRANFQQVRKRVDQFFRLKP
ncbi:MAG: hypothetical protein EXS32_01290 [Opitutus sp.]|nr:hypothetical protein [Opitutus sp.]